MQFKVPKNTEKYEWTQHVIIKMRQYGLTSQRILRVVRSPKRLEAGIVKNTIAVMQPTSLSTKNGKRVWAREIWAMYQIKRKTKSEKLKAIGQQRICLISVWRYPGVSPKRDPIPVNILREIEDLS